MHDPKPGDIGQPANLPLGIDLRAALGPLGLDPLLPGGDALRSQDPRSPLALTALCAQAGALGFRFAIVDLDASRPGASPAEVLGLFLDARSRAGWACQIVTVCGDGGDGGDGAATAARAQAEATLAAAAGPSWTLALRWRERDGYAVAVDAGAAAPRAPKLRALRHVGLLAPRSPDAWPEQATADGAGASSGLIGVDDAATSKLAPALAAHRDLAAIARRAGTSWQRVAFAFALGRVPLAAFAVSARDDATLRDAAAARHLRLDADALAALTALDPAAPAAAAPARFAATGAQR